MTITLEKALEEAQAARAKLIEAQKAPPGVLAAPTQSGGTVGEELARAVVSVNRVLETLRALGRL